MHFSRVLLHLLLFLQGCESHWEGVVLRQTKLKSWPLLEKTLIPVLGRNELRSGPESASKIICHLPSTHGATTLLFLFQYCIYLLPPCVLYTPVCNACSYTWCLPSCTVRISGLGQWLWFISGIFFFSALCPVQCSPHSRIIRQIIGMVFWTKIVPKPSLL